MTMNPYIFTISAIIIASIYFISCRPGNDAPDQEADQSRYAKRDQAYDALNKEHDIVKAMNLAREQLQTTPDDVQSLMFLSGLHAYRGEYGISLDLVNRAIAANKRSRQFPMADLYGPKAEAYSGLGERDKELEWRRKTLKATDKKNKDAYRENLFDLGQTLFIMHRYDEAEKLYKDMIKADETDMNGHFGLARIALARGNYREALERLDKCLKFDPNYPEIYREQARAYNMLGQTAKAIDSVIEYADRDNECNLTIVLDILSKNPDLAEARLTGRIKTSHDPANLEMILCKIYSDTGRETDAIKGYNHIEDDYFQSPVINSLRSICYDQLGFTELALEDINANFDDSPRYRSLRAEYLRKLGRYREATEDLTAATVGNDEDSGIYYSRGWCHELGGDDEAAMRDYNLSLSIDGHHAYAHLMRGEQYLKRGETAKAEADFRQVLQLDTTCVQGSCRQYALHFLGKDEQALSWAEDIISKDPDSGKEYYDLACLLCRMGRTEEALEALKQAYEKGPVSFAHIAHDDDLDPIRQSPEFKEMFQFYLQRHAARLREARASLFSRDKDKTTI